MRSFEFLPMPSPMEYDPSEEDPLFFYNNFAKHFVNDMVQMMNTGICIDSGAVEKLRQTIKKVLRSVDNRLTANPLIREFIKQQNKKSSNKKREEIRRKYRKPEYYLSRYNRKNIQHRTFVVNSWLKNNGREQDIRDKWTYKELKEYVTNAKFHSPFLLGVISKNENPLDSTITDGMYDLAVTQSKLWNTSVDAKAASKTNELFKFNPNSILHLREFFEMLGIEPLAYSPKTGKASWSRDQLEELQKMNSDKNLDEVLQALSDYSYSAIIQNNFLKAFDTFTINKVLYGNIKLFGAKSFRNTSNSPNLLNAPSSKSIYAKPLKKCFIAPDGYIVYTADLDGLEDKVMANLSMDENKLAIFKEDLDGHSLAACYYFKERIQQLGISLKDFKKASNELFTLHEAKDAIASKIRSDGKPGTFALAYGAYPPKVSKSLKCSLEEAENIFNAYHNELYPGITAYREEYVLPTAEEQGYLHLGLGCRIYTDDAEADIRTLVNATAQFWSILTLIAINELNYRIREERLEKEIQITSTIYDSIYSQVLKDPEIITWWNNNMIEVLTVDYIKNQEIPNSATGEIGYNWAELTPIPNNASVEEVAAILEKFNG